MRSVECRDQWRKQWRKKKGKSKELVLTITYRTRTQSFSTKKSFFVEYFLEKHVSVTLFFSTTTTKLSYRMNGAQKRNELLCGDRDLRAYSCVRAYLFVRILKPLTV
uniref:Uncharacterized protein n=1 Tax=Proboscia inermis TaxID=420281 RepID=A0A7S0C2S7_9STRA|mmetsp:Transcript_23600/g.24057  ORF Transcript_23600/g.24057 Transcript_23600/m.24057 type:complete len:107 (+) Transcript_23600:107-427(+)